MLANVALVLLAAPLTLGRPQESNEHRQVGRLRRQLGADSLSQSCHVRTRTYLSNSAPTSTWDDGQGSSSGNYEPGLPDGPYDPGLPDGSYDPDLPDGSYDPGLPDSSYEPGNSGYFWGTNGNGGTSNTLPDFPHISYNNGGGNVGPTLITTNAAESTATLIETTTFETFLPTVITTGGSTITTSTLCTLTETITTTAAPTDSFTVSVTDSISVTDTVPTTVPSVSTVTVTETFISISDGLTITATQTTTFISTQLITSISGIILPTNSINFLILSVQDIVTETAVPVVRRNKQKRQDDITTTDEATPTEEFLTIGEAFPTSEAFPTDQVFSTDDVFSTEEIFPTGEVLPTGEVTTTGFGSGGGFVGRGSDPNPQDCTDAGRFLQLNEQLFANDDIPIGVDPGVPFIDLSMETPGSITTSFSIQSGFLVWVNSLFPDGVAQYCQTPNGTIFALFDVLLAPVGCVLKDLVVYPDDQCINGTLVGASPAPTRTITAIGTSTFIPTSVPTTGPTSGLPPTNTNTETNSQPAASISSSSISTTTGIGPLATFSIFGSDSGTSADGTTLKPEFGTVTGELSGLTIFDSSQSPVTYSLDPVTGVVLVHGLENPADPNAAPENICCTYTENGNLVDPAQCSVSRCSLGDATTAPLQCNPVAATGQLRCFLDATSIGDVYDITQLAPRGDGSYQLEIGKEVTAGNFPVTLTTVSPGNTSSTSSSTATSGETSVTNTEPTGTGPSGTVISSTTTSPSGSVATFPVFAGDSGTSADGLTLHPATGPGAGTPPRIGFGPASSPGSPVNYTLDPTTGVLTITPNDGTNNNICCTYASGGARLDPAACTLSTCALNDPETAPLQCTIVGNTLKCRINAFAVDATYEIPQLALQPDGSYQLEIGTTLAPGNSPVTLLIGAPGTTSSTSVGTGINSNTGTGITTGTATIPTISFSVSTTVIVSTESDGDVTSITPLPTSEEFTEITTVIVSTESDGDLTSITSVITSPLETISASVTEITTVVVSTESDGDLTSITSVITSPLETISASVTEVTTIIVSTESDGDITSITSIITSPLETISASVTELTSVIVSTESDGDVTSITSIITNPLETTSASITEATTVIVSTESDGDVTSITSTITGPEPTSPEPTSPEPTSPEPASTSSSFTTGLSVTTSVSESTGTDGEVSSSTSVISSTVSSVVETSLSLSTSIGLTTGTDGQLSTATSIISSVITSLLPTSDLTNILPTPTNPLSSILSDVSSLLSEVTGEISTILPTPTNPLSSILSDVSSLLSEVTGEISTILPTPTNPLSSILSDVSSVLSDATGEISSIIESVTISPSITVTGTILPTSSLTEPLTGTDALSSILSSLGSEVSSILDITSTLLPTTTPDVIATISTSDIISLTTLPTSILSISTSLSIGLDTTLTSIATSIIPTSTILSVTLSTSVTLDVSISTGVGTTLSSIISTVIPTTTAVVTAPACGTNPPAYYIDNNALIRADFSLSLLGLLSVATFTTVNPAVGNGNPINAMGYNFADGLLYAAMGAAPSRLIRISPSNGSYTDLGSLNLTANAVAGVIDENAQYWLLDATNTRWTQVNLFPGTTTVNRIVGSGVTPNTPAHTVGDWTYVPGTGNNALYGVGWSTTGGLLPVRTNYLERFDRSTKVWSEPALFPDITPLLLGATTRNWQSVYSTDNGLVGQVGVTGTLFATDSVSGSTFYFTVLPDGITGSLIGTDLGIATIAQNIVTADAARCAVGRAGLIASLV
ncbi:hypothetical protein PFICI_11676 [Pestalotiopsis fici W106-1]|uniref:DUF7908 domain-containing protein n=1 Tax=Pestalotiopsis fici (strain W106-1 / CGMCC3.15140) TaxID=1229662 RepID=W3WR27_PESFW|nr:uncharacterized protein PFICI_11676 [Pestalotiopsis fici W106-1]ETS76289.1 hypothetical protein PFICI_11676 [Pestalotiopsis fici W106-1]